MKSLIDYLSNHPKTHLIFDLDETLTHLHIDWSHFTNDFWQTVAKFDPQIVIDIPKEESSSYTLYNSVIKKHGSQGKQVVADFCTLYEHNHFSGHTPNRQLINFIKNHHENYTFYIWTGNNRATVLPVIKELGLTSYITRLLAADDTTFSKPLPDGFLAIFDPLLHTRSQFLMIGDSTYDQQAAANSGIDFFQV